MHMSNIQQTKESSALLPLITIFQHLLSKKNTFGGQKKGYIIVFVRWNDPDEHSRHDLGDFGRIKEPCKANVNL